VCVERENRTIPNLNLYGLYYLGISGIIQNVEVEDEDEVGIVVEV